MERNCIIAGAVMLLALVAAANAFDPSLVVANVTDCPVPVKKWEGFTTSDLISAFAPIIGSAPPSPCTSQVQSLATCAFDGSLEVQVGCCSTNCAQQLQLLQQQNCIPFVLEAICNATADQEAQVRKFVPILLGAADRCVGYAPPPQVNCSNGRVIPVELPTTANATGAGTNSTTGALASNPANGTTNGTVTANSTANETTAVPPVPASPGETATNPTPAANSTSEAANSSQAAAPQPQPVAAAPSSAAAPAPGASQPPPAPTAAPTSPPASPTSGASSSQGGIAPLLLALLAAAAACLLASL